MSYDSKIFYSWMWKNHWKFLLPINNFEFTPPINITNGRHRYISWLTQSTKIRKTWFSARSWEKLETQRRTWRPHDCFLSFSIIVDEMSKHFGIGKYFGFWALLSDVSECLLTSATAAIRSFGKIVYINILSQHNNFRNV